MKHTITKNMFCSNVNTLYFIAIFRAEPTILIKKETVNEDGFY